MDRFHKYSAKSFIVVGLTMAIIAFVVLWTSDAQGCAFGDLASRDTSATYTSVEPATNVEPEELCCCDFDPDLISISISKGEPANPITLFEAVGNGPYSNEDNPVMLNSGYEYYWNWTTTAVTEPTYRVRIETFTFAPDGSATVTAHSYYRDDYRWTFGCGSDRDYTYGDYWTWVASAPGLYEIRLTAWPCPGDEPTVLSVFAEIVE